jgi:hypothetical protein
MSSIYSPEMLGANPAFLKWNVVRGDTSPLRIEFYENDESTPYDMTGWTYKASAYDQKGEVVNELEVIVGDGYIEINASAAITSAWGSGYNKIVAELPFDLQVTIDSSIIWTPVIGTISVIGDVTGSGL